MNRSSYSHRPAWFCQWHDYPRAVVLWVAWEISYNQMILGYTLHWFLRHFKVTCTQKLTSKLWCVYSGVSLWRCQCLRLRLSGVCLSVCLSVYLTVPVCVPGVSERESTWEMYCYKLWWHDDHLTATWNMCMFIVIPLNGILFKGMVIKYPFFQLFINENCRKYV